MLDSLDTLSPTTPLELVDTNLPLNGIIYPNPQGDDLYSSIFTVYPDDKLVITVYGQEKNSDMALEPLNQIQLYKVIESLGVTDSYTKNCSPCGTSYTPEKQSVVVESVRICQVNITPCKPLLILSVAGRYRLKIGEGVMDKDQLRITLARNNYKNNNIGFINI